MPGFTLIYQPDGISKSVSERAHRLVKASFKIELITKTRNLLVLFRDGSHYPYELIQTPRYIAIVEGKTYNTNPGDPEFRKRIDMLFLSKTPEKELEWFHRVDGEFIVYVLDKKGEKHFVFNDYLGRLPSYCYQGKQFICSRDLFIIDKVSTGLLLDEQGVYEYLRLGFPLGDNTLFLDIKRIPESALLTIKGEKINLTNSSVLQYITNRESEKTTVGELASIFSKAVKNRIDSGKKTVVSLSGGLDSRLIMGELKKANLESEYATFEYDNPIIRNDVRVVRMLSKHYQKSPKYISLKEWAPEVFHEMATLKGGMNYLGMSFILDFVKQLGVDFDIMLTGDGGDKTLPSLNPLVHLSPGLFAKKVLKINSVTPRSVCEDLVVFDTRDKEAELREFLNNIEGDSSKEKYRNFLLSERMRHWLFEGEDRNRGFIWSTSPFYNPEFFRLALGISEKVKKNYHLFREFTSMIDPELNNIINANWGFALVERQKLGRMLFRQKVKQRYLPGSRKRTSISEFQKQLSGTISELLHHGYGGQVLMNADVSDLRRTNTETLFHVLSVLKVVEMTWM